MYFIDILILNFYQGTFIIINLISKESIHNLLVYDINVMNVIVSYFSLFL